MFKKTKVFLVLAMALAFVGCSEIIPPAHKGKVLEPSGYTSDIHPPGRVSGFGLFSRSKLVLMEVGVKHRREPITVKLKDNVELQFDVIIRSRIGGTDSVVNSMFNNIVPVDNGRVTSIVTFDSAYKTYGKMSVRNTARRVMSRYTVQELSNNFARISEEIRTDMIEEFSNIPLQLDDASLGNIQWPAELTAAVNATLKAKAEIAKIQANRLKDVAKAQANEAIALEERKADLVKAQTLKEYNEIISSGISSEFLQYKAIQMQSKIVDAIAANPSTTTVFMPYDALGTIGAQAQMFKKQ